ncbi:MAG: hypothetical protein JKY66_10545 [Spongiibacteraceae bacterium]|nr:hypothetical protein [Spongiibacteraceae bacterium]
MADTSTNPADQRFTISGQISEQESNLSLTGLRVRVYDTDLVFDDLLSETITDENGQFELQYTGKDFTEMFDQRPDVYLIVYAPPRKILFRTDKAIRVKAGTQENLNLRIPRDTLKDFAPPAKIDTPYLTERLKSLDSIEAREEPPQGRMIELARYYGDTQASIRHDQATGASIVEVPFTLKESRRAKVQVERIDADKIAGLDLQQEFKGLSPAFLKTNFEPELLQSAARQIRKGNDIPEVVFPPDTRYLYHDHSFPWCTVGKVETPAGIGTGTMIGRRLMVTASHNIDWGDDGVGWIKFTPSYYNAEEPFGVAWGERVIYWSSVDASDGLSNQETAFDYVAVVLDSNMGDLTGYPGFRQYSSSWNDGTYWQQMGYPGDLSGTERPAFFGSGAITSVQTYSESGQTGYVMGNFVDTFGGHSGGPYWGWWEGEAWPRLVGVHSTGAATPGTDTSGDNEAGGGPALYSLLSYARTNYP